MRDPLDVLSRVQTDIRGHAAEKDVLRRCQFGNGYRLSLQVVDGADLLSPEEFEAAHVGSCQDDNRVSRIGYPRKAGQLGVGHVR